MHVRPYLHRIGHAEPVTPTLATLRALLRHHALAIPFENLDVQLGCRLTLLVAQIRLPDAHRTLRGRVLSEIGPGGSEERLIDSADELVETLSRQFRLDVPEAGELWPRIVEQHEELMRRQAADDEGSGS